MTIIIISLIFGITISFYIDGTFPKKLKISETITLNAAKVLGIEDSYGTIELGKSATLFISLGDALDMRTNNLSHAYIDGREISLETNQTKLWKRYKKKVEEEKSN